jgi:multiple sugar transport system substrate-binding protein
MRARPVVLALALVLAPLGARAADLVVWWELGFYPQEDAAIAEIIAAFEQKTGKQVELVQPPQQQIFAEAEDAVAAGQPPDFLFGFGARRVARWAYEDRLVDLEGVLAPVLDLFDADTLEVSTMLDGKTSRRGLYAMPMGRFSNHVHVWNSLLERAGFTLADIPKEWEAFWSFWCDQVQPAVRKAMGRDDIWGVGLPMSAAATDTDEELLQFDLAYSTPWLDRDRRLQVDDPAVRAGLIRALAAYTAIWRKGCTPPDSLDWNDKGNNDAFLTQQVVLTPNESLSIPNELKHDRPEDYHKNTRTIEWPIGPGGNLYRLYGGVTDAVVFAKGGSVPAALDFVRFLVEDGWLIHYIDFSGEKMLPPMRQLLDQPFWLDPNDQHKMMSAIQASTHALKYDYTTVSGDPRHQKVYEEQVWSNAVHRVAADGISPEQAVDEAIARIKQILAE